MSKTNADKGARIIRLNQAKWDSWADNFDAPGPRRDYLRRAQDALIAFLDLRSGLSILDMGCGTGRALGLIAERVGGRGEYYGIDLSPRMIAAAEANFRGRPGFHFLTANAESIPLGDALFDLIFSTNSFHHYPHPERALAEVRRLLKPGGKVYILDPTGDAWPVRIVDRIIRLFEPEHIKLYSTADFRELFGRAGLAYLETREISGHQKVHIGIKNNP